VLAAHVFETLKRGDEASIFKLIFEDYFQQLSAYTRSKIKKMNEFMRPQKPERQQPMPVAFQSR
jgi:hypothetical protein